MIHTNLKYDLNTELNQLSKRIDSYISTFEKQEKGEKGEKMVEKHEEKIEIKELKKENKEIKMNDDNMSDLLKANITSTEFTLRSLTVIKLL